MDRPVDANLWERGIRLEWPEKDDLALAVYVLSVIALNTSNYAGYQQDVKLTGWWHVKHKNESIKCCLRWTDQTITEFKDPMVEKRSTHSQLIASQISCPFNESITIVEGVAIQFANQECPVNDTLYTKPSIPIEPQEDEAFAVCLKIMYGNVDNTLFIDWVEYLRLMKVDKIFTFTYNITKETEAILEHYEELGIVDRRPYNYPLNTTRSLGTKGSSFYEDERVAYLDCIQRSSGFKYMSIIDIDEFLVPTSHDNFKDLMNYLMQTHPTAAGFRFESYLFVKDVGPDPNAPANGSDIMKYFLRTDAIHGADARRKNIVLPSRLIIKGLSSHSYTPISPYTREEVDCSVAAINHYRMCYIDLKNICARPMTEDKRILKFVKRIGNNTYYYDKKT